MCIFMEVSLELNLLVEKGDLEEKNQAVIAGLEPRASDCSHHNHWAMKPPQWLTSPSNAPFKTEPINY